MSICISEDFKYEGISWFSKLKEMFIPVRIILSKGILTPSSDLEIRRKYEGEDYIVEFSPKRSIVVLTLLPNSWKKEKGLVRIPEFQRYKVKCNGEELGIWYSEERNELYPPDFELLSKLYPGRKIMVAIGIDSKHSPRYPKNYKS